jgi:hypothetical protein
MAMLLARVDEALAVQHIQPKTDALQTPLRDGWAETEQPITPAADPAGSVAKGQLHDDLLALKRRMERLDRDHWTVLRYYAGTDDLGEAIEAISKLIERLR